MYHFKREAREFEEKFGKGAIMLDPNTKKVLFQQETTR